jgi:hypothetical protein
MRHLTVSLLATTALLLAAPALAAGGGTTERVSVSSAGEPGNFFSVNPDLSFSGRYVLFESVATNLVPVDANGTGRDVFLRDRKRGTTTLVSVSSTGEQGNTSSDATFISYSGRYALFQSRASNLVANDMNAFCDVFLRDLKRGTTTRVSVGPGGAEGDECSFAAGLSGNGRFVAVNTYASNLAPGTGTPGDRRSNLLVYDRRTGAITVETVGTGGEPSDAPANTPTSRIPASVTSDGRYVAFHTVATNLVPGDDNGLQDVFRRDRRTGRTELVSVALDGGPANAASTRRGMSEDGNLVVFTSAATDLVPEGGTPGRTHVYVRDMRAGTTKRVSVAVGGGEPDNNSGFVGPITANGRYVLFASAATDLVADDGNGRIDAFVHDLRTGTTTLVSLAADGAQGNADVVGGDLAPGGRVVAWVSDADNLVEGDVPSSRDIFVRGSAAAQPRLP